MQPLTLASRARLDQRHTLSANTRSIYTSIWAPTTPHENNQPSTPLSSVSLLISRNSHFPKDATDSHLDTMPFERLSTDQGQNQNPPNPKKCIVCLEEFDLSEGSATCSTHFMHRDCLMRAFRLATQDHSMESFPAKCCGPVDLQLCGHLIPRKMQAIYKAKSEQFDMDPCKRVYCHNCGWWLHPHVYDQQSTNTSTSISTSTSPSTTGECPSCSSTTCMECKNAWRPGHTCSPCKNNYGKIRPAWLPPYSDEARVKQCPAGCHTWIELVAGYCNHMRCRTCGYEFCFICLMQWSEFHTGCPSHGEPACGYDREGYELDRGIHRDTGRDRRGRSCIELEMLENAAKKSG
jgi:hypothetical protein